MTKADIITVYKSLSWTDKVPRCCTDLKVFQCPCCKQFMPIDYLAINDFTPTEDILNDKIFCQKCWDDPRIPFAD